MSVLIYLIPLALLLGFIGLIGFIWSLKSGQYEDLDGAAQRILIDDDEKAPSSLSREEKKREEDDRI